MVNIALKHIYTQENASHVQEVENLLNLLSNFLGESREICKNSLGVLHQHIEIAKIMKKYKLLKKTFKEFCRLSEQENWIKFTEQINQLTGDNIKLVECGSELTNLQKTIISEFVRTVAETSTIFGRDEWENCFKETKRLHVNSY